MNEIEKIENYISQLTINNIYPPKAINEFEELNLFKNFEDLKNQINDGLIKLVIPNHLLYNNFEETSLKKYKFLSSFFLFSPILIGLIFSIVDIKENNNYWILFVFPLSCFANYLSAFYRNFIVHFLLVCVGIYFMINLKFNLGAFIIIYGITIISSILIRTYRRIGFISSALSSEKIFCFLFYARNISIYDRTLKIFIKSL